MRPTVTPALAALVLVLAWSVSTGEARAADGRAAGAAAARLVPVWVQLDGGLPVDLGRVSVIATTNDPAHVGERRPLRQRTGRRSERTNPAGVAMLDFARLPKRFTVVVRGGRAHGRRVRGALYAEVTGQGSDVVEVNPVTTLSALARTAGGGMEAARARREVKRLLAIPSWHDTTRDLRHSDEHFDGEAYLEAARRRGSLQALNRVLLAELHDGDRDRRRFRELDVRAAQLQWLTLGAQRLVAAGFEQLANFAVGKLAERKKDGGLGWFTAIAKEFGFGAELAQLAEIQSTLQAFGKQLTELQGQVEGVYRAMAQNELSALAHQTDTTLGQIDHAESQLALLANLDPDDPTLPKFAQTIEDYIGSKLLDAPTILHRNLKPGIPLADDVFKATSRAIAASTRVFDKGKQAQVEAIYNYFAVYQTQLAILLANYWHSKPDTYGQETIRQSLIQIQRNVTEQRTSLKPPPPDGTWIDPASGLMWTFTRGWVSGTAFWDTYLLRTLFSIANPAIGLELASGVPFSNWRLAGSEELTRHTSQINGNGRVYLNAELASPDALPNWTWTSDSWLPGQRRAYPNRAGTQIRNYGFLRVFNLDSRQFEYLNDPLTRFDAYHPPYAWPDSELGTPAGRQWLASKRTQGLLYVRQPAAGEDYWWGSARAGG
jgi:hypothetical protein